MSELRSRTSGSVLGTFFRRFVLRRPEPCAYCDGTGYDFVFHASTGDDRPCPMCEHDRKYVCRFGCVHRREDSR